MTQKICRLCFNKKTRPIGIFTAKGIKLKIDSILRLHYQDEVSEDDALPKFVCSHCWTTTRKFHEFYNTVIEAKNAFLANSVGNEQPTFNEINCDSFGMDVPDIDLVDIAFVKLESLANEEDETAEKSPAPFSSPFDYDGSNDCDSIDRDNESKRLNGHQISEEKEKTVGIESVAERYPKYDHGSITKELTTHPSSDLTCDSCEATFQSLMDAKSHYRKVHKNPHGYIKCCKRRLKTRGHLIEHIQWHMNPDIFKCQECQKLFDRKHTLMQHMKVVHSAADKLFECDVCKSKFKLYGFLKAHILHVHERKFEQICDQCGKVYVSKAALKKHKRSHVESTRVQCTYCSVMMRNEFALSNHISRIHKSSPANCPHCPKISPNPSALAMHIRARHNFKVHKCHMCDRACKSAMALKEHLVTHTDAYLYQCIYCPKKFKSHSNMYQHFREAHPVEWSVDRKTKPREKKPKPENPS